MSYRKPHELPEPFEPLMPPKAPELREGNRVLFGRRDLDLRGTVAECCRDGYVWVVLDRGGSLRMGTNRLTKLVDLRGLWIRLKRLLGIA